MEGPRVDSFRHGWTQGLSVIRSWSHSFLLLALLFSILASFPGSLPPHGTSQKLQADILPQLWSESLSLPLVLAGLPKQTNICSACPCSLLEHEGGEIGSASPGPMD